MSQAFSQTGLFLIDIIFSFYISLIMLRFFLQWVKADFYNPLCQFVTRLTNPLVLPLRRIIPGFFGLDWASVVLMILVESVQIALLSLLTTPLSTGTFVLVVVFKLLSQMLNLYFFVILARAFMSFSTHATFNPLYIALSQLSEPLLRPVRRILPPISGFDLSPALVLICIQALLVFLRSML